MNAPKQPPTQVRPQQGQPPQGQYPQGQYPQGRYPQGRYPPPTPAQLEAWRHEQWLRYRQQYGPFPRKYNEAPKKYPRKKGKALFTQIFGCVSAFICVIALVLSLTVMPMVSYEAYSDGKWVDVNINALDLMECAREAVFPTKPSGSENGVSGSIPDTRGDGLVDALVSDYRYGEVGNVVPVLIFALGHIVSAVLAVVTLVYFIYCVIGIFSPKYALVRYECSALRYASLTAGVLLVLQLVAPLALNAIIPYGNGLALLTSAAVLLLSLLEALFCALFISEEARAEKKRTVKSALCAMFCAVIMLCSFAPYAVSGGSVPLSDGEGTVFYNLERDEFLTLAEFEDGSEGGLNGTKSDTHDGWHDSYLAMKESYKRYSSVDVKNGVTDGINENIVVFSLSATGSHKYVEVFSVVCAIFAPLCIACTLFLSEMLKYLYFGETHRGRYKAAKILLAVTGVIAFGFAFSFVILAEYAMLAGSAGYFIFPSIPFVISFAMAVAASVMKSGRKKLDISEIKRPYMFEYKYLDY